MFDWLKSLWGTIIKDGELAKRMQRIPCVVHKGESFRPGTPVNFGLKIFVVKHVFISNDLMKCSLMVTNVANEHDKSNITEEIMLDLDEVIPMQNWELSESLQAVSKSVASISYSELFDDIPHYPLHIKREMRKHMLISKLRRTIHYFLTGLEMVGNFNLGLIDWEHDPHFIKRSILMYKIEDSKHDSEVNEFDILLGPKWDMVDMSVTMDSFRIVLTMEIKINTNGELCVTGHAATCALVPDTNGCAYRAQYLRYSSECHSEVSEPCNRVGALSQNSERKPEDGTESIAENRTSLIWDSFNAQKEPDMFSTPMVQDDITASSSEENSILSTRAQAYTTTDVSSVVTTDYSVVQAYTTTDVSSVTTDYSVVVKTMSESGNSSLNQSRVSQSTAGTASTRPRLQGLFQTGPLVNNQRVKKTSDPQLQQQCPFPNEWQFGTVPEVITNDEDID